MNTKTPILTGDPMVLATQLWLNKTYGNDSRYVTIPETAYGKTGWTTIYALTRALQIELGIQATADSFGPTTQSLFTTIRREDGVSKNLFGIVQGALWCKGYNTGHYAILVEGEYLIQPVFDESVENAVKQLESDAGRTTPTGEVDVRLMKALLSMDAFVKVGSGDEVIRSIQQYLNANYEQYIGLSPCDGVYGRGTNKALIYAIQAEEKMSTSVANGNFGPSTKRCCPTIPYNNVETTYTGRIYTTDEIKKFIKLAQMGLYVNGFGDSNFDGIYDQSLITSIQQFQQHYAITTNGLINLTTWLSIFISSGDTSRSALACDCATILTAAKAKTLYDNGYRYVGRYLSGKIVGGASKALSREELEIAFSAGLRVFPIQQASANTISYFTETQAEKDAESALYYASSLGIPNNTTIYFAVDCDPQDYEITSYILPYFKRISELLKTYRIGVYGTRNVCRRVSNMGYAVSSFVSDMSTGFSGNLGFIIPNNWAFDQFATITVGTGTGQIEIDKDGFSGRDTGFGEITPIPLEKVITNLENIYNAAINFTNGNSLLSNKLTLQYIRREKYNNALWETVAGEINQNFCDYIDNLYPNLNFTFYDPVAEKNDIIIKYDIAHLAATLNALLFELGEGEQAGLDELSNLYAGWAGDVMSFTANIANISNENSEGVLEWARTNICRPDVETYFTLKDYIADIDAINIARIMNSGLSVASAFSSYFKTINSNGKTSAERRTGTWIDNVGTVYLNSTCNLLLADELKVFAMLLAKTDNVEEEHMAVALDAFKYFVNTEYANGR